MPDEFFRYCQVCLHRFAEDRAACPSCGVPWRPAPDPPPPATAKAIIEALQDWRRADLIGPDELAAIRASAERSFGAGIAPVPPPIAAPAGPPSPPLGAAVPRAPGPSFAALIAERQADVLLYLGAFLLGVAALIFVSYQEDAVSAAVRVPVLAGYTVAGVAGGILVRRWARVREAGHVFLALGALLLPLNVVLLYVDVLSDQDVPGDVVWLIGSAFCALFYGALAWRGFGWLYRAPATIAALSAWTSLIPVLGIPGEWGGAWYALLGLVLVLPSPRLRGVAIGGTIVGSFGLLWALAATSSDLHHGQLPAAFAIIAAGSAWIAYRIRYGPAAFVALLLAALTVTTGLWALDAPRPFFAYAPLAAAGLALAYRERLGRLPEAHPGAPWWYAAALTLAPLMTIDPELRYAGWSGIGCLSSSAVWALIAWKNTGHGMTSTLISDPEAPRRTMWGERIAYAWVSAGFALGAASLLQHEIGVTSPERGWLFAAFAALPALAVILDRRLRGIPGLAATIPISAVATVIALPDNPELEHYLHGAAFAVIPTAAWLAAFAITRRWTLAVVAAAFAVLASFYLRAEYQWVMWSFALALAAGGLGLFGALTPIRGYGRSTERSISALILSAGLQTVAILAAVGEITSFQSGRDEVGRELFELTVERGEYRVLIALIALSAGMVAFEGLRLGNRIVLLPASAIGMVAVVLAISLSTPENMQAYTVPIGSYLLAVGLVLRRSPALIPPHLLWHEVALVAGVLFVVLPQAEQSFGPDGTRWGLALIAEGLVFLAVGFMLRARWLVPAGTLVLSGVAIRWLLESSETVPYWVTLGAVGTLLLAVGLFALVNAEWWAKVRARASRWWQEPPDDSPGDLPPHAAA